MRDRSETGSGQRGVLFSRLHRVPGGNRLAWGCVALALELTYHDRIVPAPPALHNNNNNNDDNNNTTDVN